MASPSAHRLLDCVLAARVPTRLSVVGICKNAGKTVTLNHLIRAAAAEGVPLGLISTGRDGEEQDAITELPKPRIWAPAGTWLATARGALAAATAQIDGIREFPMETPFGPVVLGRVSHAGEVLLIGPGSARRTAELLAVLESGGARLCLVDGSFDRIAAAAPATTGRAVLAVGAAYSVSMEATLNRVRYLLDLFDLPAVPAGMEQTVGWAMQAAPVCVAAPGGEITPVPVASGLGDAGPILSAIRSVSGGYLVLRGALTDVLLQSLIRESGARGQVLGEMPVLVVSDPTHVLAGGNLWRRWLRLGGRVYVRRPVRLVAVTTNSYSPVGPGYDARKFFDAVSTIARRPTFDLEAELVSSGVGSEEESHDGPMH